MIKNMAVAFGKDAGSATKDNGAEIDKLHLKIDKLVVERDFFRTESD